MSATASWLRKHRLEVAWAVFALANLAVMGAYPGREGGTVPFHFIWVSLTLLYGFTVWRIGPTAIVLGVVMASTAALILLEVAEGPTSPYELTEVPLMAAMFVAMVWHARTRLAAEHEAIRSRERERDFIRDSSHHLKTPLQLARSYAELVQVGLHSGSHRQDAGKLLGELDRLAKIVDGLLVYMTSEEPQVIDRREVALDQLIYGVAGRWMDAVDRVWAIDVRGPGSVLVDAHRLEYAIDALIENAVTATVTGGRVAITAERQGDLVFIRIADDGRGIEPAALEHIFERFWTQAGRSERSGTGLGLAIVKAIVDAHDGDVTVQSSPAGTEFTITLDRGPAQATGPTGMKRDETSVQPVVSSAL